MQFDLSNIQKCLEFQKIEMKLHPLQYAIKIGKFEAAKKLATKENILLQGLNGMDAVDEAAMAKNYELLELFCLQICVSERFSLPLFIATEDDDVELFKFCFTKLEMDYNQIDEFDCRDCGKKMECALIQSAVNEDSFEILKYIGHLFGKLNYMPNSKKMLDYLIDINVDPYELFRMYFRTCWASINNMKFMAKYAYKDITNLEKEVLLYLTNKHFKINTLITLKNFIKHPKTKKIKRNLFLHSRLRCQKI